MTKSRRPTPPVQARGLATVAGLAVPQGLLWLVAPTAVLTMVLVEITLAVIIVLTALYGPERVSRRAFLMLGRIAPGETGASGTARRHRG